MQCRSTKPWEVVGRESYLSDRPTTARETLAGGIRDAIVARNLMLMLVSSAGDQSDENFGELRLKKARTRVPH